MNELENKLLSVSDSYDDFVAGIMSYVHIKGNEHKADMIINFINLHPAALSSDIVEYVTKETDFFSSARLKLAAAV